MRQLADLNDAHPRIEKANATLLALSADAPDQSASLVRDMNLAFDLLCDPDRTVIKDWGIYNPYEAGGGWPCPRCS